MGDPTAILYTADEARRFRAEDVRVAAVLALNPDVRVALAGLAAAVIGTTAVYRDSGHARALALARRADGELSGALEAEDALGPAARRTLRHDLHLIAACAARLWVMLRRAGTGPWLVARDAGWARMDSREEAHACLLERLAADPANLRDGLRPPPLPGMARLINRFAASGLRGRRVVAVTAYQYGMGPLMTRACRLRPPIRPVELRGSRGRLADLAHPVLGLLRRVASRGEVAHTLVGAAEAGERAQAAAERALAAVTHPAIRRGIEAFRQPLISQAALTEGVVGELMELLGRLGPRALLAHALRWSDDAALGEACAALGIPSLLISHGSHPGHLSGAGQTAAETVLKLHGEGMLVSALADETLVQSPHADAAARAWDPGIKRRRARPVMWGWREIGPRPAGENERIILHAGTFKTLTRGRPWMYETADEFVAGLEALIRAVEAVADARLVVRLRPSPECSPETLRALLPHSAKVEFKTGGSFLDDLAAADLLVSFSSTTIEEAIHARRPVLLWGGSMRYRHLPARTSLPTPKSRGAIYAPVEPKTLSGLIAAVLDAHAGRPLSDDEIAPHVWPADTADADALVDEIAVPAPRPDTHFHRQGLVR